LSGIGEINEKRSYIHRFLSPGNGPFWAGQGADLIRWPAESFMVNARQWIYYGGGTAVIGLVLILLARR
jgi:hypothetical protein